MRDNYARTLLRDQGLVISMRYEGRFRRAKGFPFARPCRRKSSLRNTPDYHVERNAPRGHGSTWGWLAKLARLSPVLSRRLLAQEIEQQRNDLLRLLLLYPVPGAVEQLTADHAGADLLRAFESARRLVDAPVARAADKDRWPVARAPGK